MNLAMQTKDEEPGLTPEGLMHRLRRKAMLIKCMQSSDVSKTLEGQPLRLYALAFLKEVEVRGFTARDLGVALDEITTIIGRHTFHDMSELLRAASEPAAPDTFRTPISYLNEFKAQMAQVMSLEFSEEIQEGLATLQDRYEELREKLAKEGGPYAKNRL